MESVLIFVKTNIATVFVTNKLKKNMKNPKYI